MNRRLKNVFHLAWPAILQEALNTVVTYVDTAMVGALGANASATVGLTGSVGWLMGSITLAFGVGVLAVSAQSIGANNKEKAQIAGQQALILTLIVGIVLTLVCCIISPFLPTWLNGDPLIRNDASVYFFIISLPFLFRTGISILSSSLRGVSDMKTPMKINLYMNIINIALNYLLIYPTHKVFNITVIGAGLEVKGAAIATAVSYVIGGLLILRHYLNNQIFKIKEIGIHYNKQVFNECLSISIPVVMERGVICMGHVAFASLIAKLGVIQFAAHTIAIQAEQAFYVPGYGFQSAASTLVGNAVGEADKKKVKQTAYLISGITFLLMLVAGIILFIFSKNLMSFFTPDQQVVLLGSQVLKIVSISEPIYGVLVILEGTFNGIGDTKAPFVFSLFTMWGIRILGSWIMINIFHFGLSSVWIMMVLDNVTRCFLLAYRFLTEKWQYRVT